MALIIFAMVLDVLEFQQFLDKKNQLLINQVADSLVFYIMLFTAN